MKNFNLLVFITQLGLSVIVPLVCLPLLAIWLRDRFGLGDWVVAIGVIVGILFAVEGLRSGIKAMTMLAKDKKEDPSPIAFNEHE